MLKCVCIAGSANGRPTDSESVYFGSNPNPAASKKKKVNYTLLELEE